MPWCSPTETIRAAKKQHICEWCAEKIEVGQSYCRYRHFAEDVATIKIHPECNAAMQKCANEEGGYFEFTPHSYERGEMEEL